MKTIKIDTHMTFKEFFDTTFALYDIDPERELVEAEVDGETYTASLADFVKSCKEAPEDQKSAIIADLMLSLAERDCRETVINVLSVYTKDILEMMGEEFFVYLEDLDKDEESA